MSLREVLLSSSRQHAVTIDADARALDRDATLAAVAGIAARLDRADVLVACTDRVAFVHAVLATWTSGRRVLLPPNLQPRTVESLAASDATIVLHDGGLSFGLAIDRTWHATGDHDTHDGDGFVRLFTSGSTGEPKAIDKSAAQLLGEARVLASTFDLAGRRILCAVPFGHVYGLLFGVLVPLVADATIIASAPLHAEAVRATIEQHGVDVLCTTPAQLRSFAVLDRGALDRVRTVFSSGAPLPGDTATMLRERHGIAVIEVLGSSETGGIATRTHDDTDPRWQPLPGVLVDADDDGRMIVRAPWAQGIDVPTRTEDRITLETNGFVHRGRMDDVVKVAGRRVALGDMVARTLEAPGVDDAAASVLPATDGRGVMIGLAVATTHDATFVREHLARWFEPSVIPRVLVCVPTLGRDATGKLPLARLQTLLGRSVSAHDRHEVELTIDPALPCFAGHFPGDPIYPGAMLLDAVVFAQIARAWPALAHPSTILRTKFSEPIRPGDALVLQLVRRGDDVAFDVRRGAVSCASGRLRYAGSLQ